MTLRNKITLLYLATYGSVIFALSLSLFLVFKSLEYRRIDSLLLAFHNDIVNTYKYADRGENKLLSLAGDENFGFAIFNGEEPLASFRTGMVDLSAVGVGVGVENEFRYFSTLEPINEESLKIVALYSLEETRKHLNRFLIAIMLASLVTLLLVSFIGRSFTRRLIRPLEEAGSQLEKITRSELKGERVSVEETGEEISKLQLEINKALDRIEKLVEDTKLLSAKIAHELRTPLAVMKSELQIALEREVTKEEMEASLGDILRELDKLIGLSEGFLLLSRIESAVPLEFQKLDLSEMLLEAIEKIMLLYPKASFELDVEPGVKTLGVAYMIEHVLLNLLENAAKYSQNGVVNVRLFSDEDWSGLEIVNQGEKIELENLNFKKPTDLHGHGIGLTVVNSVLKVHEGKLLYTHRRGYNEFEIHLKNLNE